MDFEPFSALGAIVSAGRAQYNFGENRKEQNHTELGIKLKLSIQNIFEYILNSENSAGEGI